MVKYVKLDGYNNLGEIVPFSHFYQFMQLNANTPMIILLHAYECDTKAFKGYLWHSTKTFESVPLTKEETKTLEPYVGSVSQVGFDQLIAGTDFEESYVGYQIQEGK